MKLYENPKVVRSGTASQLAIAAYRCTVDSAKTDKVSQAEAARIYGANPKRVSEAKKIAVTYGRLDILELLHNGQKFNTGTDAIPFWTDSLGTIMRWLAENAELSSVQPKIFVREELTEDEQALTNSYYNVISKESTLVRKELISMLMSV